MTNQQEPKPFWTFETKDGSFKLQAHLMEPIGGLSLQLLRRFVMTHPPAANEGRRYEPTWLNAAELLLLYPSTVDETLRAASHWLGFYSQDLSASVTDLGRALLSFLQVAADASRATEERQNKIVPITKSHGTEMH
jgi:hypothetical protein